MLSLSEKLELLQLSLGIKLATEIYTNIQTAEEQEDVLELLSQLPFPFFPDSVIRKNKTLSWVQVCLNESVREFLTTFGEDLTEYEEGILYGFPLSAIRAFAGLIESKTGERETAYEYFLAGVGSARWQKEEMERYQKTWQELKKLSPNLIEEAEQCFLNWQQKQKKPTATSS